MTTATGKFEVASWDEVPFSEVEGGGKLTRASVKQTFKGDIAGEGSVEYLMCYRKDGTASFVGLQRIDGRVHDRTGSFVLTLLGEFDGGAASGTWSVVPGSATGELDGLRGDGGFEAPLGPQASVTLEYDLEE
jgi:Protein of unknown function (DUF3224)